MPFLPFSSFPFPPFQPFHITSTLFFFNCFKFMPSFSLIASNIHIHGMLSPFSVTCMHNFKTDNLVLDKHLRGFFLEETNSPTFRRSL